MIRELNCHEGQGFYFAKPLKAETIATLLANQFHWAHHFTNFDAQVQFLRKN